KKEKDHSYQIDYSIPKNSQLATLELITSNQKKHSQTIVLNDGFIDLQFFPESGELVHGLSSNVGFKAIDAFGSGTIIQGDIIDQNNNLITSFKSNALGMGSFELTTIDSTQLYYAKLPQKSGDTEKLYPLPKIASFGNIVSVSEKDRNIMVNAQSNYLKNDTFFLNVSFRGATLHDLEAKLKNGTLKFMFSSNELPEGIIVFKMMDKNKVAVAERVYFNKSLENNLKIKINTDKKTYSKRELTNLSIETVTKKEEPIPANTSILIINKEQLGAMQINRENIASYFLM